MDTITMETQILSQPPEFWHAHGMNDAANERDDADMGYISYPVKMTAEMAIKRWSADGEADISHEQADAYAKGYNAYLNFK
jgi:hypothetical protein